MKTLILLISLILPIYLFAQKQIDFTADQISVTFQGDSSEKAFWKSDGELVTGNPTPHWRVEPDSSYTFLSKTEMIAWVKNRGYKLAAFDGKTFTFFKK